MNTTMELIQFVSSRLGSNAHAEELQKLASSILRHMTLEANVLQFVVEHYLKLFSRITCGDIFPYFRHSLDTSLYKDHQAIRPYRLQRSRLPMRYFKSICSQLDVSRFDTRTYAHTRKWECKTNVHEPNPFEPAIFALESPNLSAWEYSQGSNHHIGKEQIFRYVSRNGNAIIHRV